MTVILIVMDNMINWIKSIFAKKVVSEIGSLEQTQKYGETLSPNIRALRLTISMSDVLLSMGVAASDVVSMGLDVVEAYSDRKAQFDVTSTIIILSQDRGDDREPLTLVRTASPRIVNNMTIQSIQELVRNIADHRIPLEDAERAFDSIMEEPRQYSTATTICGSAMISAGVAILYTGSPIIIFLSFLIGAGVAYVMHLIGRKKLPAFYAQVAVAAIIIILVSGITWLGNSGGVSILADVNPTLIAIGGIVMLVAGLMIVGAVQDAIDEYYVTANAKILKVIMMTSGIVTGVLIGLYFARLMNIDITVTPERMGLRNTSWQYIGAIIMAAGYTLSNHSRWVGVILAGILGGLAWYTYLLCMSLSMTPVASTAIAAIVIGSLATLISRAGRVPSVALLSAGVIPLVPGMTIYNGLMQVVNAKTSIWTLNDGLSTLLTALFIALAIAAGASFGTIIGRPLRSTLVHYRNKLPTHKLNTH